MHHQFLLPVLALVAWTLLIWIWMYATRVPAILRSNMKMDPAAVRGAQMAELPATVRWKADNYNHLLEQPTLFYALALVFAVIGTDNSLALWSCWAYVVLRIVHTLVQTTVNLIELRFGVFVCSTLPLFVLVILGFLELV